MTSYKKVKITSFSDKPAFSKFKKNVSESFTVKSSRKKKGKKGAKAFGFNKFVNV